MTTIRNLTLSIEALRNEQTSLIVGSGKLCAYGITDHVPAVSARLTAIKAEARAIADQLDALGATYQADDARSGWAIVIPHVPAVQS